MYSQPKRFLIALAAFAALLSVAWFVYRPRVETDLTERATKALADGGFTGITVSFDQRGRSARLSGEATDPDVIRRARETVEALPGVSQVDSSEVTAKAILGAAHYRLFFEPGRLIASGRVGTSEDRDALIKAAGEHFPGYSIEAAEVRIEPGYGTVIPALAPLAAAGEFFKSAPLMAVEWHSGTVTLEARVKDDPTAEKFAADVKAWGRSHSLTAASRTVPFLPSPPPHVELTINPDKSLKLSGRAGSPEEAAAVSAKLKALFPDRPLQGSLAVDLKYAPWTTPLEWLDGAQKVLAGSAQISGIVFLDGKLAVKATVPDEAAKQALTALTTASLGEKATADIIVRPPPPPQWFVSFAPDKKATVSGAVPDQPAKDALAQRLKDKLTGWEVKDAVNIVPGTSAPGATLDFIDGLPELITSGGTLTHARAAGDKFLLTLTAPDEAARTKLNESVNTIWAGKATASIMLPPAAGAAPPPTPPASVPPKPAPLKPAPAKPQPAKPKPAKPKPAGS